ncbi:MAG: hypothetical protein L0H70_02400, partial [Xanthomonadales bacterium]|nr:hypothetical protein [Xanthomonadales bacterium]
MSLALALSLLAGVAVSLGAMLPAQAATTAITCTENNHNGCTELSPTPPQDTVAVPPNIVLMLDDSGSMKWNFMPDFSFLNNNGDNDALINATNNGVYYNPTVTYSVPPKADGTSYTKQTDMTNVPVDGFGVVTTDKFSLYTYDGSKEYSNKIDFNFSKKFNTTTTKTYDETVYAHLVDDEQCVEGRPSGNQDGCRYDGHRNSGHIERQCVQGQPSGNQNWCRYNGGDWNSGHYKQVPDKTADQMCLDKFDSNDGIDGTYAFTGGTQDSDGNWLSGECKFDYTAVTETKTYNYFQYSTGPADGPYVVHSVAPASQGCGDLSTTTTPTCVLDTDISGAAAPAGVSAAQNIANWFAYYHTRLLMAKSGLMTAFTNLQPSYRFGFASINANGKANLPSTPTPYGFDNSGNGAGSSENLLAVVQPFGLGSDSTSQKSQFWTWLDKESGNNGTPLRKSLQAVGEYYKTAQPWSSMPGDPGYTATSKTTYACRASYTILTTDGFWNGSSPGVDNADNTNGTKYTPPAGSTYTTTGYVAAQPFSDDQSNTLADVALKYWATDLSGLADEVAPNTADPAFWQHMTTFTMGLGFVPDGIKPAGTTIPQIFAWAHGGTAISNFSWPDPSSDSINNIADLAHAAVNGHGDFFSVKSPQDLAAGFAKAIADISARNVAPKPASVNASVAVSGALAFSTGYNTGDWSGTLQAMKLNTDGTVSADAAWKAETKLDASYHTASGYSTRKVYSGAYAASGFTSFQLTAANVAQLDSVESTGLMTPASTGATDTA